VISICYDRQEPGQDHQAMACYRRLQAELTERGYYSYRLGIQSMHEMGGTSGYADLVRAIKDSVDPNGILAPGRYEQRLACSNE
jgi:4-cresol dehydrogenase (hydroxylating)